MGAEKIAEKPIWEVSPLSARDQFRLSLRDWFFENGLQHPWRETEDPWAILVSEIMLQQTTVGAVREGQRFEKFLAQFPDVQVIAKAPEEQLLRAWEGLGYYNRVRNLQKTAIAILAEWDGRFPHRPDQLETLPGVGPYTAGAIASFAFDEPASIVDGNIARVFSRLFDDESEVDSTSGKHQLWSWAEQLLDRENPRLYNSALMEVGQVFCRPKKPSCGQCPIARFCQTREPERLPIKKPKARTIKVTEHAILALKEGKILLACEEGSRRKGFYHLPLRSDEEVADWEPIQTTQYAITKHKVTLHLYRSTGLVPGGVGAKEVWFSLNQVEDLPMPSPVRRALLQALDLSNTEH